MVGRRKRKGGKKVGKTTRRKSPKGKRRVKKGVAKRRKKKAIPKAKRPAPGTIGVVTHYFPKVSAAVIRLKKPLAIGDRVLIKGHTTYFTLEVKSMQINHQDIQKAKRGDEIGLEVTQRVRNGDLVFVAEE